MITVALFALKDRSRVLPNSPSGNGAAKPRPMGRNKAAAEVTTLTGKQDASSKEICSGISAVPLASRNAYYCKPAKSGSLDNGFPMPKTRSSIS